MGMHKGDAAMRISQTITRIRRWRSVQDTVSALQCLTDRQLDDLGIARWQIDGIARREA